MDPVKDYLIFQEPSIQEHSPGHDENPSEVWKSAPFLQGILEDLGTTRGATFGVLKRAGRWKMLQN